MTEALQNLKNLLGVGESLLKGPWKYDLAFGTWDCGTVACFFGHFRRRVSMPGFSLNPLGNNFARIAVFFGITETDALQLFGLAGKSPDAEGNDPGVAAYQELAARLVFLRALILSMELHQDFARRVAESARMVEDDRPLLLAA